MSLRRTVSILCFIIIIGALAYLLFFQNQRDVSAEILVEEIEVVGPSSLTDQIWQENDIEKRKVLYDVVIGKTVTSKSGGKSGISEEWQDTLMAVLGVIVEIESTFAKEDVAQNRTGAWGSWQVSPRYYIYFNKKYNRKFDFYSVEDNCELAMLLLLDNLDVLDGSWEKAILAYCSGFRYLDKPYEELPKYTKKYVDDFNRLYPKVQKKFGKALNIKLKPKRKPE